MRKEKAQHPSHVKDKKNSKKSVNVSAPSLLTLFPDYRRKAYVERASVQEGKYLSDLKEAYKHKGLSLYLGAGVSRSLGLFGWQELIRSLTVTMMTRKATTAIEALGDIPEEKYWQIMQPMQKDIETEADPSKPILMMARAIKDELGDKTPFILARTLYRPVRGYFYRKYSKRNSETKQSYIKISSYVKLSPVRRTNRRPPFKAAMPSSPLLDSIVSLARSERDVRGVQAIVNYNYDDLVEEKLREESVRCLTVRSGKDRVPEGVLPCYHVHGVLPVKELWQNKPYNRSTIGNFVFSEDEYHEEYSDPYRWSNMTQMSLFGRYTGLFLGLSMEDPNIRRLVDVTHKQYPDILNYAILPRKKPISNSNDNKKCVLRNLFEEVESSSFSKIGVKVIWVDRYEDIPKIINRIYE